MNIVGFKGFYGRFSNVNFFLDFFCSSEGACEMLGLIWKINLVEIILSRKGFNFFKCVF